MSILNQKFVDAKDILIVPAGEHKVEIVSAESKVSQAGNTYVMLRLVLTNPPDEDAFFGDIYQNLFFPQDGQNEQQQNRSLKSLGDFVQCFDLPCESVQDILDDLDALVGREGYILVKQKLDQNDELRSEVRRYLVEK